MVTLGRVEPFVWTAELRSFRAAARHLGVTPAAISKAIAALEAELGVLLLHRTSRHVAPTPEGEVFLRHCRAALEQLTTGQDLVTRSAALPQGRLKVSLSPVFGRVLVSRLASFVAAAPRVSLVLSFSDAAVDLAREEVDVALRIGELPDSSLVARRLRTPAWVAVASPDYLRLRGVPERPADLARHDVVSFALPSGRVQRLQFTEPAPTPAGGLQVDLGERVLDAAQAGLGIGQVFDFMAAGPVGRGELVEVLSMFRAQGPPVHTLCLPGRQHVPRIRAFLDFAEQVFGR